MSTRSPHEDAMLPPSLRVRTSLVQRHSNLGNLDSNVTGEAGRALHDDGPASDSSFEPQYMTVVGLHFKWCSL